VFVYDSEELAAWRASC